MTAEWDGSMHQDEYIIALDACRHQCSYHHLEAKTRVDACSTFDNMRSIPSSKYFILVKNKIVPTHAHGDF